MPEVGQKRETDRLRHRQTDRQRRGQADRGEGDREAGRQAGRDRERKRERQRQRQTDRQTDRQRALCVPPTAGNSAFFVLSLLLFLLMQS